MTIAGNRRFCLFVVVVGGGGGGGGGVSQS